jgi:hypothetical protein
MSAITSRLTMVGFFRAWRKVAVLSKSPGGRYLPTSRIRD